MRVRGMVSLPPSSESKTTESAITVARPTQKKVTSQFPIPLLLPPQIRDPISLKIPLFHAFSCHACFSVATPEIRKSEPAVGRVLVYDDGDEATVLIENVTHGHFNPYDEKLSEAQRDETVTADVIDFLKALFSDRVLLHCTPDKHRGGWVRLDLKDGPVELSPASHYSLWSRPYQA